MSSAVNYTLNVLKGINMKYLGEDEFYEELSWFINALGAEAGDYKVDGITSDGELIVQFMNSSSRDYSMFPQLLDKIVSESPKISSERCASNILSLVEKAIGKEKYRIVIDNSRAEELKKLQLELKDGKITDPKKLEDALLKIRLLQWDIPTFEIYSKKNNMLLGKMDGPFYHLSSTTPGSLYVMEIIGKRVFECKEGKLKLNPQTTSNELEKSKKVLMRWGDFKYMEFFKNIFDSFWKL